MYHSGVYLLTVTLECRAGRIWGRGNSFLKSYCEIVLEPLNGGGGRIKLHGEKGSKRNQKAKTPPCILYVNSVFLELYYIETLNAICCPLFI